MTHVMATVRTSGPQDVSPGIGDDVQVLCDDVLYEGRVVFHNQRTEVLVIHPRFVLSLAPAERQPYDAEFFITSPIEEVVKC